MDPPGYLSRLLVHGQVGMARDDTTATTQTHGTAMSEGNVPVGGSSSRMGAGEVGGGVVDGVAVAVEVAVEVTLRGGLWMLGGCDIGVVHRVVLRNRRHLDGGVEVFPFFAISAFDPLPL